MKRNVKAAMFALGLSCATLSACNIQQYEHKDLKEMIEIKEEDTNKIYKVKIGENDRIPIIRDGEKGFLERGTLCLKIIDLDTDEFGIFHDEMEVTNEEGEVYKISMQRRHKLELLSTEKDRE